LKDIFIQQHLSRGTDHVHVTLLTFVLQAAQGTEFWSISVILSCHAMPRYTGTYHRFGQAVLKLQVMLLYHSARAALSL
jgi:hypothetical protein